MVTLTLGSFLAGAWHMDIHNQPHSALQWTWLAWIVTMHRETDKHLPDWQQFKETFLVVTGFHSLKKINKKP